MLDRSGERIALTIFLTLAFLLLFKTAALAETWQADFSIKVLSPRVKTIFFKGRIYVRGLKVRIEPEGSDEVDLYDFEQSVSIRIFPVDGIYFEKPLSQAKVIQGFKEGWVPPADPFHETKLLLREGMFKGAKARLTLITLENKQQKAYLLRWETDDERAQPLRVIYPGSANETIIVDYHILSGEMPPTENFDPPVDFLSLNPF